VSISAADHTESTEKTDREYHTEYYCTVHIRMPEGVHVLDGIVLDSDVDREWDIDDDNQEDEEEEDEGEENKDEEEDEDEDDGKEPQMIGQGKMVNTTPDDVDSKVDDQPIVLSEKGQNIHDRTP
jgi:hypothetical protein